MHRLYDLKDKAIKELELYGGKDRLDASDWEVIDLLAHTTKNLCKVIESYEEEEEYSNRGGYSNRRMYSRDNMGDRGSYARRRDSMGRYSREGARDDLMDNLHSLMNSARTEAERQEYQRMIDRMGDM